MVVQQESELFRHVMLHFRQVLALCARLKSHHSWLISQRLYKTLPTTTLLTPTHHNKILINLFNKYFEASCHRNNTAKMTTNSISAYTYIRLTFGYSFNDTSFLDEALDTTGLYRAGSNQSLALIGDSVLQANIYRDWYPSKQPKGSLTET